MELGALRAFVEAGLHNVDARLDQQADMLAQMQGMVQDAVLPGHAGGGGVAQQGAPVGIAEGPCGPTAGVAGPGELPGGAAPLAVAGPGSRRENGRQSTFRAMAEPNVPQVLDYRGRTAFADGSEAPGDPGPAAEAGAGPRAA